MVWHSVTIPCCHIGKVSLAVVRDKETGILIFVEWGCSSMLLSFRKCTREKLLELAPHEELCSFLHREKYRFPIWHSALGSPTTCHHQPKWLSFQLAHQTNVVLWAIPGKKYLCAYNQHFLTPIGFWKLKKNLIKQVSPIRWMKNTHRAYCRPEICFLSFVLGGFRDSGYSNLSE